MIDLAELEAKLKAHDWFYDFSDDHRVWQRGRAEWEEIKRELDARPEAEARILFEKYAPKTPFPIAFEYRR